jgi:hypothetical protein
MYNRAKNAADDPLEATLDPGLFAEPDPDDLEPSFHSQPSNRANEKAPRRSRTPRGQVPQNTRTERRNRMRNPTVAADG